jgi:hypothetical protein
MNLLAGKYLKCLAWFMAKLGVSAEDHLADFLQVMDDFDMEHEDVCANPRRGGTSMVQIPSICLD